MSLVWIDKNCRLKFVVRYQRCTIAMIKTISANELHESLQRLIALTQGGDEIVIEENGKPTAKLISITDADLERELRNWEAASDEDYLKFESELAETR